MSVQRHPMLVLALVIIAAIFAYAVLVTVATLAGRSIAEWVS